VPSGHLRVAIPLLGSGPGCTGRPETHVGAAGPPGSPHAPLRDLGYGLVPRGVLGRTVNGPASYTFSLCAEHRSRNQEYSPG